MGAEHPMCGFNIGPVAQLVRAPPCHGGGRGFESLLGRKVFYKNLGNIVDKSLFPAYDYYSELSDYK